MAEKRLDWETLDLMASHVNTVGDLSDSGDDSLNAPTEILGGAPALTTPPAKTTTPAPSPKAPSGKKAEKKSSETPSSLAG